MFQIIFHNPDDKTANVKLSKNDPHDDDDDDDDNVRDEGPLGSFPLKENISYELGQCQHSGAQSGSPTQLICKQTNTKYKIQNT